MIYSKAWDTCGYLDYLIIYQVIYQEYISLYNQEMKLHLEEK